VGEKKPFDILLERLNIIESKLNKLIQQRASNDSDGTDVQEIKQMMILFLDQQSRRKDFAGRNAANTNNNASVKKEYTFPIERIPEEQRPPHWNLEVGKTGNKQTLWNLYQTSEGREFLTKIVKSDKTDEHIERLKKRVTEFSSVAKEWYIKLVKIEKGKQNKT